MTRASFSADTHTIDVALPKSWGDLTQTELAKVYDCMERHDDEDVRFYLLRYFIGLKPDRKYRPRNGRHRYFIKVDTEEGKRHYPLYLSAEMFAGWVDELNWISEPGSHPVRLDSIGDATAVNAMFHGVTFKAYYMVENYYQGYMATGNKDALQGIERLLYPFVEQEKEMPTSRVLNILNWVTQVKTLFASLFPHFFSPAATGSDGTPPNMTEVMNNEIRILTGGDVTKEEAINNTDCWRALTELDFKAKEAEELRRQRDKNHK